MPISRGRFTLKEKVDLKLGEFPEKQEVFETKGWNRLKDLGVCNEPLVREFYANTILKDGYMERKSWVRNHFVKYDVVFIDNLLD